MGVTPDPLDPAPVPVRPADAQVPRPEQRSEVVSPSQQAQQPSQSAPPPYPVQYPQAGPYGPYPAYPQPYYPGYPPPYGPYPYYPYYPPPKPPDPLRWLNPFFVLLIFLLVLVITALASIPLIIYVLTSYETIDEMLTALMTPAMLLVQLVIQDSIFVLVPYFVYLRTKLLTWAELGLSKMTSKDAFNRVGIGIAVGLVMALIVTVLTAVIENDSSGGLPMTKLDTPLNFAFMFIGGAIIAPIAEEIFFRGIAFKGVMKWMDAKGFRWSFWVALLFSSIIFAGVHGYDYFGTTVVFVAALVFAWLFKRTESLLTPIMAHAAYNGALITIEYLMFS